MSDMGTYSPNRLKVQGEKLLFVVNDPKFFISHRLPIAKAASEAGYEVHIGTEQGSSVEEIEDYGFVFHPLPINRSSLNPFSEIRLLLSLIRLFKRLQPDLIHLVTIKPVLYGSIVARLTGVPAVVAAICGLGNVFIAQNMKARCIRFLVKKMYRFAFRHKNIIVIFQNPDDQSTIVKISLLDEAKTVLIKGSGVSLEKYQYTEEQQGIPTVTMTSRLLRDKGVKEFIEAARILKSRNIAARFWLVGEPDPENPASVRKEELLSWCEGASVEFMGYRSDIDQIFANSHVIVLPSYREGLPKVLIEAAACGRAVITTDVPGCRDSIEDGKTGMLVPARDSESLANAIEKLVEDPDLRKKFGKAARKLAEREFAIEKVVNKHMSIYRNFRDIGRETKNKKNTV